MSDVEIRSAHDTDRALLVRVLGQEPYFTDRLARQRVGKGVLLVAFLDEWPIGGVYLHLEAAEEGKLRRHLPGVPLLTHLEIVPGHRGRGFGTQLIDATENCARQLGHDRIALAVGSDNPAAARLYRRLGYIEWQHDLVMCFAHEEGPGGRPTMRPEWCRVLVKKLGDDGWPEERSEDVQYELAAKLLDVSHPAPAVCLPGA